MISIYAWKLLTSEKDYTLEPIGLPSHIKSLNDLSLHWPQGVYTTFRTFNHNKVLPLDMHFSRLEESAKLIGKPVILNRDFIRLALSDFLVHSL